MSRDVCIKRNSYCPICKGVVMADCWHDSSQFSGGEMSDAPKAAPLTDLLRAVPKDLRAEWPIQFSEDGRETGHAMSPIGRDCHAAADRIEELERQLAVANAELAEIKRQAGDAGINERAAQLTAHRACCGTEHDPSQGKLHGCCVVCGVPWPCAIANPKEQDK